MSRFFMVQCVYYRRALL